MVTPDKIRTDAASSTPSWRLSSTPTSTSLDVGSEETEQRNRGTFAFYEIRDKIIGLMVEMDEFAGHMEVCNAIFAANQVRRGGAAT